MGPKNKTPHQVKCHNNNRQQNLLQFFTSTVKLKSTGDIGSPIHPNGSRATSDAGKEDHTHTTLPHTSSSQTGEIPPSFSSCSPKQGRCGADTANSIISESPPMTCEKPHRSRATGRCEEQGEKDEDNEVIMLIEKELANTSNYPEGCDGTSPVNNKGSLATLINRGLLYSPSSLLSESISQNSTQPEKNVIGNNTDGMNMDSDVLHIKGSGSSWGDDVESDDDEPALPPSLVVQHQSRYNNNTENISITAHFSNFRPDKSTSTDTKDRSGMHDDVLPVQQSLHNITPRTTARRQVQTQLDLGQALVSTNNQDGLVTCKLCGMMYQHCPDDITFHKRHCKVLSKSRLSNGTLDKPEIYMGVRGNNDDNMQLFPSAVRGMCFPVPKGKSPLTSSTHRNGGALFDTQFELRAFTHDINALLGNGHGAVSSSLEFAEGATRPSAQNMTLKTAKGGDRPLLGLNTIRSGAAIGSNSASVDSFLVEALLNSSTKCSNVIRSGKKSTRRNETAKQKVNTLETLNSLSNVKRPDSSKENTSSSTKAPSISTLLATLRSIATHRMFYSNNTNTTSSCDSTTDSLSQPPHALAPSQESKREFLYFLVNKPLDTWEQHGATAIDWRMVNIVNYMSTAPLHSPSDAIGGNDVCDNNIYPPCSHSSTTAGVAEQGDNGEDGVCGNSIMSTVSCEGASSICSQQTTPSVCDKINIIAQHHHSVASGAHWNLHPLATKPLAIAAKFFPSHCMLICVSLPFHSAINEANVCHSAQQSANGGSIMLDLAFICCYTSNPTRVHEPELHITNQASHLSPINRKTDESSSHFKLRAKTLRSYITRVVQPTTQLDVSYIAISPKVVKDSAALLPSAATFFGKANNGSSYIYRPLPADIRQHNVAISIMRTGLSILRNKTIYGVSLEFNQLCFLKYWLVPLGMMYYGSGGNMCASIPSHISFTFEDIFYKICEEEENIFVEAQEVRIAEEVKKINAATAQVSLMKEEEKENKDEYEQEDSSNEGLVDRYASAERGDNNSKGSLQSNENSQATYSIKPEKTGDSENDDEVTTTATEAPIPAPRKYISSKSNSKLLAQAAVRKYSIPRCRTGAVSNNKEVLFSAGHPEGNLMGEAIHTPMGEAIHTPFGEEIAEFILSAVGQPALPHCNSQCTSTTHEDTTAKPSVRKIGISCHVKGIRTFSKLKNLSVTSRRQMREGMKTPTYERLKVYIAPGVLESTRDKEERERES